LWGRAFSPRTRFPAGPAAWKGGCGHEWPPHRRAGDHTIEPVRDNYGKPIAYDVAGGKKLMSNRGLIGLALLGGIVLGVMFNFNDIVRYVRISRM
jgi:hypothetical protein